MPSGYGTRPSQATNLEEGVEAGVVLITLDDGLLGVLKEVHKVGVGLHERISLVRGTTQNCIKIMIIIIMYIYHALINALSAHMIRINLNMILYTHVEHSPTKTIYIKYYKQINKKQTKYALQTHTHTDCSRNWVLILVRMEIL